MFLRLTDQYAYVVQTLPFVPKSDMNFSFLQLVDTDGTLKGTLAYPMHGGNWQGSGESGESYA